MPVTMRNYEVDFRGPTSSDNTNTTYTSIQRDLLTANRLLERENSRLTNYLICTNYNDQIRENKISTLSSELQQVKTAWDSQDGTKIVHTDFHSDEAIDDDYTTTIPAFIDIVHGNLRLPTTQSWSKIPVFRNQDGFLDVTDDVSVYLTETSSLSSIGDGTYQDRTTGIYRAMDRNPATIWVKEWVPPSQPNYAVVRIALPTSINPAINSVLLHPFPNWGLDIKGVDYLSLAGNWVEVTGSAQDNATYKMFHFYARDYNNQIRVKFVPSETLTNLDGDSRSIIGIQNLDVGYIEYQSQAEIVTVHQGASVMNALRGFQASYTLNTAEAGDYSAYDKNYIWWEVFPSRPTSGSSDGKIYDSRTNVYPLTSSSSSIPVNVSTTRLYVRTNFVGVSATTPLLSSITINYI